VLKILESARSISEFPLAGRMVPEREDENIRERIVYNYRLIYRITHQQILISAIIHGRQQLESISDRLSL